MRKSTVSILGMHRSGTSCLAGSLEQCGLHLGEVKTQSPHNLKGNREHPSIFNLQERLFNKRGNSWDNPPAEIRLAEEEREELQGIIESFDAAPIWGFKDPRTLFTLDDWRELLTDRKVFLLASIRHPLAVAQSLLQRNKMDLSKGLSLWMKYNEKLLQHCLSSQVELIDFDSPFEKYDERLVALAQKMDLEIPVNRKFYEGGLINQQVESDKLDASVQRLYDQLLQMCDGC